MARVWDDGEFGGGDQVAGLNCVFKANEIVITENN
jgi:hypothetical protein